MNKEDINELFDLVGKYNGEAKNSNESDTLDELIESNKQMKSNLKELYIKVQRNPELWDTDGICHTLKKYKE